MAFKLVKGYNQAQQMFCGTSSTIVQGNLVAYDRSNKKIIPYTAALLACDVAGVASNTPTSTDTQCMVIPPVGGQLWEYDTTNNTAAGDLCIRAVVTDALTVNNTGTDSTSAAAVVMTIENAGAASAKKARGFILGGTSPKALS